MQFHLHPWLWTLAILYFTFLYNTHSIKCYCSYIIKSISRFTLFFAFYYFSHFWASTGDFCSAYLSVVKNSLSFALKISLFCLHFWKIFSSGVEFFIGSYFISTLWRRCLFGSGFQCSIGKSVSSLPAAPLKIITFSSGYFWDFLFALFFSIFTLIFLHVGLLVVILLGVHSTVITLAWYSPILENWSFIFKYCAYPILHLLCPGNIIICIFLDLFPCPICFQYSFLGFPDIFLLVL